MDKDKLIDRSFNGILIIKARNANFNAGFDGEPRTLPDGTIFATDKALKYCIREYLATFKGEPVFVRRNRRIIKRTKRDKKGNREEIKFSYQYLGENFYTKLRELVESDRIAKVSESILSESEKDEIIKWVKKHKEKILKYEEDSKSFKDKTEIENFMKNEQKVLKILKSFIDVRLFGVVFSVNANISLTGPVQISYGINKLKSSSPYPVQILSPYKNPNANAKKKEGEEKSSETNQTTIGEETRADEIYYVYNISINSANAKETGMTYDDLKLLKEALLNSVDVITSTTKYGAESVALIWLNNKENFVFNNLDEFVSLKKDEEGKIILEISNLKEFLKKYGFEENIKEEKYNFKDFDFSEKEEDKNKIVVIYKEGKINLGG